MGTRRRDDAGTTRAGAGVLLGLLAAILLTGGLVAVPPAAASAGSRSVPTTNPSSPTTVPTTRYQVSLGDSLAAGTGASTDATRYVNQIEAHEAAEFPGLTLWNLACGGATTSSMITGPGCSYSTGTQLGDAEAFLRTHPGQVPYITIDIGANDVDRCLINNSTSIDLTCLAGKLATVAANLHLIITGLQTAAPGVPIFGMDYYNPFLYLWVSGLSGAQTLARGSAAISAELNSDLVQDYARDHAVPVDVQGTFATQDFALTGTWAGVTVPQNVARTCEWTHMCDNPPGNIHANDTGHGKVAGDFEQQIDRWHRGGGQGAWLADAAGGVHVVGSALSYGSMAGRPLNKPIVTMAATNDGAGYWLVASDGGIFAFGDATFFGSTGGLTLNQPIVGFAPTADDRGYWEVASDGGVFAYGDATFLGSMGGSPLNQPVVGMAQSGSDRGYWLVARDGGIFAFGDAGFKGSTGGTTLNKPVVGMAATIDGNGYWLVASDGGIFSYGDAVFHGSTGSTVLNRPIIGMTLPPDGYGYTLGASDGGLFAFGNATFNGSLGGAPPTAPIVAVVST